MLKNTFIFTKTIFDAEAFLEGTGNQFRFVSQRPYLDKNGKCGIQGTTVTLLVTQDTTNYGIDKQTGKQRESNELETFDATILNGETHLNLNKGDIVSLVDYDPDHSYVMGFELILRFKDIELIESQE